MKDQNHIFKHLQVVSLRIHKDKEIALTNEEVNNQYAAEKIFRELLSNKDREVFAVLCMDVKGKPVCYSEVHVGTLNKSIIHPREVFKIALLSNAYSIIVAHNHPSGDDSPSYQDREITKTLYKAGVVLGVSLIDHLIITDSTVKSLRNTASEIFKI
jgi:DNA repair protein RadC